jgi:hypothetical protein
MQVKNDGASEWLPKDGRHGGQGSDQWLTYVDFFFFLFPLKKFLLQSVQGFAIKTPNAFV